MKRSLLFKLILCYIILISLLYLIVNITTSKKVSNFLEGYNFNKMDNISKNLINSVELTDYFSGKSDIEKLTSYVNQISQLVDCNILILDSEGNILINTIDNSFESKNKDKNISLKDSPILQSNKIVRSELSPIMKEPHYSNNYKIKISNSLKGYVVTVLPVNYIDSKHAEILTFTNLFITALVPIIAGIFILIYFLTIEPVHRITKYAVEYSKGKFDYKLNIKTNDEYKQLADAIQYMIGELNNLDEYQRKFIGNISHDFRSPLTSIKGYVEAMLDNTIPVEDQGKYLNIILFEAERLSNLTTNLLELNNFDNNKRILEKSIFDINFILKKTGEVYEGRCSKNKITIKFNFEEPTLYVYADLSQIQQVINNLVDNAIKFSPQYSNIVLSTSIKNEKVFVSIKDSGYGIPKSSLNKIWDRFYKTDPSRGKDKKGTGLGLAIAREIINAHHENINVISTEGVGTEFIFSLSKPTV